MLGMREGLSMTGDTPAARRGWDLVTSRPLTLEQTQRADELAAVEAGTKAKPKEKPSGKRRRT